MPWRRCWGKGDRPGVFPVRADVGERDSGPGRGHGPAGRRERPGQHGGHRRAGDRAGIRTLDAVLEVNGIAVKNFSHFSLLLDGIAPGAKASLLLLRRLKAPDQYPEQNAWNTLTVEMEAR